MRVDWCVSSWFRIKNTHSHVTRCRASGQLGALLSSPVLGVRLMTALQVLQDFLHFCSLAKGASKPTHAYIVTILTVV